MLTFLKRVIAALPLLWQQELKRRHYRRQIECGTFVTDEPEYAILDSLIVPGSLIVDVGANVGHYTKKLSDLAGPDGRVIAFEPVPETFSILAANVSLFQFHNVSLMNAAASDTTSLANIQVPRFETGLRNWYEATVTTEATGLQVMTLALDALQIPQTVCLVKIDAEDHELQVLHGMKNLLLRDHPILIVEANSDSTVKFLESMNYTGRRLPNSPNILFE